MFILNVKTDPKKGFDKKKIGLYGGKKIGSKIAYFLKQEAIYGWLR